MRKFIFISFPDIRYEYEMKKIPINLHSIIFIFLKNQSTLYFSTRAANICHIVFCIVFLLHIFHPNPRRTLLRSHNIDHIAWAMGLDTRHVSKLLRMYLQHKDLYCISLFDAVECM